MRKIINQKTNDFKELIESNSLYIDKTLFIKEIIDNGDKSIMIPRPRRFGKTLNLSMLYYYFSNDYDYSYLFKGLDIMKQDEKYLREMNKYPTIFLSFKDLKKSTFDGFIKDYKTLMSSLYGSYEKILMNSQVLSDNEKKKIKTIIDEEENDREVLPNSLYNLVRYLNKHYNKEVIVLLDEYDAPILHAYEMGYYEDIIPFIKQIFVTTFKPNPINPAIKKGIITGITRISKENLFSDANNIKVYNITDNKFATYFGFTEEEVIKVLDEKGLKDKFDGVKKWYDGYLFNRYTIYNPWSILSFLGNIDHDLIAYWVKTGGVGLLKNLIYNAKDKTNLLTEFEDILDKGYKEHVNIDLNMDLKTLKGDPNTVWTLFLLTGYLTPTSLVGNGEDITLRIPNLEVKKNLTNMAASWFINDFKGNTIVKYLINETIDDFRNELENIVLETFSYLDVPGTSASEAFYHAFVMGLIRIDNDYYEVISNRESGYGRYDLVLKPKVNNIPLYIIEFKLVRDDSTFDKTIEMAFEQIEKMKYDVSVKDYSKVIKMAIAFKGKKLRLETR